MYHGELGKDHRHMLVEDHTTISKKKKNKILKMNSIVGNIQYYITKISSLPNCVFTNSTSETILAESVTSSW